MIGPVSPERQWEEIGEQEEGEERTQGHESDQGCEEAARANMIKKAECAPSKQEIEQAKDIEHFHFHLPLVRAP